MDQSIRALLEKDLQSFQPAWDPGHPREREIFERFVRIFARRADDPTLAQRSRPSLLLQMQDSLRFIALLPPGRILVRVFNPKQAVQGWSADRTVLETCMRDQPFLVDTLRLYLRRAGLGERACYHPILGVRRDAEGRIEDLGEAPIEGTSESFIHFEIEPVEPQRHDIIAQGVRERLEATRVVCDDFPLLVKAARDAVSEFDHCASRFPERADEAGESGAFLHWLIHDHFIFLGYRAYEVSYTDGEMTIALRRGSGLGLGRNEARSRWAPPRRGAEIPEPVRTRLLEPDFVLIEKASSESPIHRPGKIDHISVKRFSPDGRLTGFGNFLGLFTHQALEEPGSEVPILRRKLAAVLEAEGAIRGSHLYKEIEAAFDSIPLEYLFLFSPEEIHEDVRLILGAQARNEIGLNVNRSPEGRSALVMLVLPPGKYSEELCAQVERRLTERLRANYSDHRVFHTEVEATVLHFYFTGGDQQIPEVDHRALSEEIRALTQSWEDRMRDRLLTYFGEPRASELFRRYASAFPEPYQVSHHEFDAVHDIERLEALLAAGELQVSLLRQVDPDGERALHLNLYGMKRTHLADSMPVLGNLGLRVVNQIPTEVRLANGQALYIDTFHVEDRWQDEEDLTPRAKRLEDALRAIFGGAVDNDPLNRLVLEAGLGWREIDVFRAYVSYTQQIGSPFSRGYFRHVLISNVAACLRLCALFDARFNPGIAEPARADAIAEGTRSLEETLRDVQNFNEDRALRAIRNLIESTVRTNFYRRRADPYFLTLKIDGSKVDDLPLPRPAFEILVRGPGMVGVHLRCGKVARGGIRWSDRLEDYRSEILGLMKTQHLKNALIVPVGAKGGFILKTRGLSRAEERALADARYEIFIRALLDVTDNIVNGRVLHPDHVVVHDGEDPYLVVAADKGTAHLSDTANRIAGETGFWLGDAFASGGSHGYDHKKEGITAKGAWTCIRRHFLERGVNLDVDPIRVVGIGDMSGDVFGNGMLLARRNKLVGAFNHLHVFIDPDPDAEASWRERERLFRLPRSTWEDYDRKVLSPGGGVYRRDAKSIPLPPEARKMLGVEVESMSGEELVRALLRADVDLLWNGGIGTYIKASSESHLDAGDKANDGGRVDATEVRAKVIGEGGNLGVTQRGRIELALRGTRINTDAIDNSAGVDLSDHEVNLKIGLTPLVQKGKIDFEGRNRLIEEAKSEICAAVTEHNWSQGRLLSLDEIRSRRGIEEFAWLIEARAREGSLHRENEGLPTAEVLGARRDSRRGLTRPELAVLLGHAKLDACNKILASHLIDAPAFYPFFDAYFPETVRRLDPKTIREHRLRHAITATQLANHIVDWAGICFFREMTKETGRDAGEIAAAYVLSEDVLGVRALRVDLEATGFAIPVTARYEAYLQIQDALEEAVRWVLPVMGPPDHWGALAEEYGAILRRATVLPEDVLGPARRALAEQRIRQLGEQGLPEGLARRVRTFRQQLRWVSIGQIAREAGDAAGWSLPDVARLYYTIGEATQVDWLLGRMANAPKLTEWDKMAYGSLRGEIIQRQHAIALGILTRAKPGDRWEAAWGDYRTQNARVLDRIAHDRREIESEPTTRFTPFSVLGQMVKSLP